MAEPKEKDRTEELNSASIEITDILDKYKMTLGEIGTVFQEVHNHVVQKNATEWKYRKVRL